MHFLVQKLQIHNTKYIAKFLLHLLHIHTHLHNSLPTSEGHGKRGELPDSPNLHRNHRGKTPASPHSALRRVSPQSTTANQLANILHKNVALQRLQAI